MKKIDGLLIVGIIFLIIGLVQFSDYKSATSSGYTVEATITKVTPYYDGVDDNNYHYYGTYTWEGEIHENVDLGDSAKEYKVGDTYKLVIKPESEGKVMTNGGIFIGIGVWLLVSGLKNTFGKKKENS